MTEWQPLVFVPTDEDKKIAEEMCNKIIDMLSEYPIQLKAFILQNLIEGFEDAAEINLRQGVSIRRTQDDDEERTDNPD